MYILLVLSIVLSVLRSGIYNNYAKDEKPGIGSVLKFNIVSYGAAAVMAVCFDIGKSLSIATMISALFYAVTVCSLQALTVIAMKKGSMSRITLMSLYGMIIPTVAGPIFWKENIGICQIIGVVFVLVSMWLLQNEKNIEKGSGKKCGVLTTIIFFLSGFVGVIEKIHQSTDGREEKTMFLFIAYIIMFLISVCGLLAVKNKENENKSFRTAMVNGGISGVITGFRAFINLTLAGKLNSMIYYPVANGGALLLTVFLSAVIFREKSTKKQIAGFIIGFLAIILLSLPI